jgi:6-phosphogluconolactonase (cycloisomerase 2 family)
MSAMLPFTTRLFEKSLAKKLSLLAIAPLVFLAACGGGDDNGGGAPPSNNQPPGGGTSAVQNAYAIAGITEIQAYKLDNDGNLTPVGTPLATGGNPHHVNVDPAGRFVYVSNHDSPFLSGWRANADASLVPMNAAITGSPVTGTDASENESHWSVLDQTGRFLYVVAGTGASTLRAYNVNQTPGDTLGIPTFIDGQSFPVGTHAHNVVISPNNQFLYVASENPSGEVHAFSRDTATGALTPVGAVTFAGFSNPATLVVDPNNRFLYVGYENAIEVFSIGANGALTRIAPPSTFETNLRGTGAGPHSIAMHPNGQTLYVANIFSNTLSVFRVDQATGALTEIQIPNPGTGLEPNHVMIHPNGRFLYTADTTSDQLSRFAINADGTLATPATVIPAGDGVNNIGFTRF